MMPHSVLRKEVIQPHVPVRLPCYDFVPVTSLTLGAYLPKVSPATSAQDCIGIAVKSVASGDLCPVLIRGRVKVKAGGTITRGKAVYGADSNKRILQLTDQPVNEGGTGTYTIYYNRKLGTALESASAADDLIFIVVAK